MPARTRRLAVVLVAIDRAAGVVLRAEDDGGAVMTFREHRRGPLPPETFELP